MLKFSLLALAGMVSANALAGSRHDRDIAQAVYKKTGMTVTAVYFQVQNEGNGWPTQSYMVRILDGGCFQITWLANPYVKAIPTGDLLGLTKAICR